MTLERRFVHGFSLIEVLIALAVIAIALTALMKATSQSIVGTQHLKEKTIAHLVAMEGLSSIQLGMTLLHPNQEITEKKSMLGSDWYWHARSVSTPIKSMQKIEITVGKNSQGPFSNPLTGFQVTR
ncbi:MAG: type II secretion system minor pseudopilin GspI [Legionellaceae bacterium]